MNLLNLAPTRSQSLPRNLGLFLDFRHPCTVSVRPFSSIFELSNVCLDCHTRYYPNYYVHADAQLRTYYLEQFEMIQISQHFYMSSSLCKLFTMMMVTSWTSATNCACIFNSSMINHDIHAKLPLIWTSFELDVNNVWDGFFLHALLLDSHEHDQPLILHHDAPSQLERLSAALDA